MPVVLVDHTNSTWCVEDPRDGFLHVGITGKPGPKLQDVLEFINKREAQFNKFLTKKKELENKSSVKPKNYTQRPQIRGANSPGVK